MSSLTKFYIEYAVHTDMCEGLPACTSTRCQTNLGSAVCTRVWFCWSSCGDGGIGVCGGGSGCEGEVINPNIGKVCQMLSWWSKNSLHSINNGDTVINVVPLCSVYPAPSYEPNLTFLAPCPT